MQKRFFSIFLSLVFFSVAFSTHAATTNPEARIDLFRFDDVVEISSPVTGDLYTAGREVILRGSVRGDILAVGAHVIVMGPVEGDVRIVGETVELQGLVKGNVSVVARTFLIGAKSETARNVLFAGEKFDTAGTINGDVEFWGVASLPARVRSSAVMNGAFTVRSAAQTIVEDGASLQKPVTHITPEETTIDIRAILFDRIIALFGLFIVGLVVIHLMERPSLVIASIMNGRPFAQIGWGFACIAVTPLIALILFLTIIGIPLALILMALLLMLLYGARVFVALAIGFFLVGKLDRKRYIHSLVVVLLVGTVTLILLESIPILGFAVMLVSSAWGIGAVMTLLRTLSRGGPEVHL